ncbi:MULTISPECIES: S9 family peptidase [Streptomyces]|uniref:S9 family peptidase n=1 Tax=Streptomyces TaxID=1883 RepID=UPI001E5DDECF|nr:MULTISPECIES: prolyl oligopeptidase family serine peptidase [Streptomyces]UFQ13953.1 prolyl oligopeptidase family serine peptidase [Streptomyces huasconensis]WCL83553.1 prolyl oligopeptidase family serine peptidase [Streptomyces sp. JCM 35825]
MSEPTTEGAAGAALFDLIRAQQRLKSAHRLGSRLLVESDIERKNRPDLVPFVLAYSFDGDEPTLRHAHAGASSVTVLGTDDYLFLSNRRPPAADPVGGRSLWRHREGREPEALLGTARDVVGYAAADRTVVAAVWVHAEADSFASDRALREESARQGLTAVTLDGDLWPRSGHRFGAEVLKLVGLSLDAAEDPSGPELLPTPLGQDTLLSGQLALTPDGRRCAAGLVRFLPGGHRRHGLLVFSVGAPDDARQVWAEDDLSDTIASPDGAWFACTAERIAVPGTAPRQEAALVSSDGLVVRKVGRDHRDWLQPRAWQDPKALLCTGEEDGRRYLWRVAVDEDVVTRIDTGGSVRSVTARAGEALVVRSTIASPPSVVTVELTTPDAPRAEILAPAVAATPRGRMERLTHKASDGTEWSSWLCLPEDVDRELPVLVWCHGGPMLSWTDWSWRWNPWPFVADGYAVLMPDPPLSVGYGQDAIERGWGKWTSEVAAVAAEQVADALLDPRLDADRVAVMGASFGGFLSLALGTLLRAPRLIVSHCGWADFAAVSRACDLHWHWLREYGPVDSSPSYRSESLALEAISPRTKVLLSHGCEDTHVPVGESRAMYRTLDARGVDVELMLVPDERHSILRPANAAAWHRWVARACRETLGGRSARKELSVR